MMRSVAWASFFGGFFCGGLARVFFAEIPICIIRVEGWIGLDWTGLNSCIVQNGASALSNCEFREKSSIEWAYVDSGVDSCMLDWQSRGDSVTGALEEIRDKLCGISFKMIHSYSSVLYAISSRDSYLIILINHL